MTVTESDRRWIRLEKLHIDFADDLAARRRGAALEIERGAREGHEIERPEFDLEVLGARCEAAGKLFLNPVKWHAFSRTVRDLPDLDDFIDVKGAPQAHHSLLVQEGQPDNFAYLLILGHAHPDYEIVGWAWGWECKKDRELSDPVGGMPAYFVGQDESILKPPDELREILRERQQPEKFLPGFVGYSKHGLFIHMCHCGVWGAHGYGVSVRTGKLGTWYCAEHNPERREGNVGKEDRTEGVSVASPA